MRSRVQSAGTYRHVRTGNPRDLARTFGRLKTVRHLYHSKGSVTVTRHPSEPDTVLVRVLDYAFSHDHFITVQSAYAIEAARILGVSMTGGLTGSKARGDAFYEWPYHVTETPEKAGTLALLPVADV